MENKQGVFQSLADLEEYTTKFSNRFTHGEIQVVGDKTYMWDGEKWIELKLTQSNSGVTMTMYDLNAQIINQLPAHTEEQIQQDIDIVNNFYYNHNKGQYFMLLCKEASYFTIFTPMERKTEFSNMGNAVIACAQDLGEIRSVENLGDTEVEIWVCDLVTNQMYCMHLFDYTVGVVGFDKGE